MSDDEIIQTIDLTRFERDGLITEATDWIENCDEMSRSMDAHPRWAQYREKWKAFLAKLEPKS